MTVSVLMAAYNSELTIESAIHSVLSQSHRDLELLVVDDGSVDATGQIIRKIALSDSRLRLIRFETNRGIPDAQNQAIREARGKFFAIHDSDDLWHPRKIERHLEHLASRPQIGVSYAVSRFMNSEGGLLPLYQRPKLRRIDFKELFCRHPVGNGSNAVFRRETMDGIAFQMVDGTIAYVDPRSRRSHDMDMWMRIKALTPWEFEGIDEVLTYYRISPDSHSSRIESKYEDFELLLELAREYAPQEVQRWGGLARAYQLRYLARRAFMSGKRFPGVRLFWRAMLASPIIFIEEPGRTLLTGLAVHLQMWVPFRLAGLVFQKGSE